MTRSSSLILIAAIAITSFIALPAVGQFPLPKIKLPKIVRTETTTTPTNTDNPVTSNSDSSSPARGDDRSVRGMPIPGARITFSNSPDGSNPKTSFSSSEYIYGRLDLGGKTMYDAFGFKALGNAKFYYIDYDIQIWKPGEKPWDNWSGHSYTLVTKEEAQKTYWIFDVLPDPSNVRTIGSAIADEIEFYNGVRSVYSKWYNADSARSTFPQSGTYTIDITLFGNSYDDWGKPTGDVEKYPTASAAFAFQFSGADGQTLVANSQKAKDSFEAAKNRREMLHAMPDWWYKPATGVTDAKLAPARLVPMIKGFIGQWNMTYMKHMIINFTGPLWVIEKNSLGIPEYRMVKPYIYVIYK